MGGRVAGRPYDEQPGDAQTGHTKSLNVPRSYRWRRPIGREGGMGNFGGMLAWPCAQFYRWTYCPPDPTLRSPRRYRTTFTRKEILRMQPTTQQNPNVDSDGSCAADEGHAGLAMKELGWV